MSWKSLHCIWVCFLKKKKHITQTPSVLGTGLVHVDKYVTADFCTPNPSGLLGLLKCTAVQPVFPLCTQEKMANRNARCVLQNEDKMTSV